MDGTTKHDTKTVRGQILDLTRAAICNDRQKVYGPPEDSFAEIAGHWNWWLGDRLKTPITAYDAAQMMAGLKQARCRGNHAHLDNAVDQAGYSAIAGEIGQAEARRELTPKAGQPGPVDTEAHEAQRFVDNTHVSDPADSTQADYDQRFIKDADPVGPPLKPKPLGRRVSMADDD